MNAEGVIKTSGIPFKEVFCFDLSESCTSIGIKFYKGAREIASGELIVPSKISNNMEVDTEEKLVAEVYGLNVENSRIVAIFNLTFINSKIYESQVNVANTNNTQKAV
jgi:hypothetical protein